MSYRFTQTTARISALFLVAAAVVLFAGIERCSAQSASNNDSLVPSRRDADDQPKSVREFLAKQRTEKARKDHEELLKRGEEVIALTEQLDAAFGRNNQLTRADLEKLESLEKLVSKIRRNLGGDNDDDEDQPERIEERSPSSVQDAFSKLKDATSRLVDELKRSSRFTVSVLAIQSTNSVLKIVRFLRFRK